MIILITGASHTGKTLLAQRILEKKKYPYFSIDHLKMGLIRSGYTELTPENDDLLTEYIWPIIREIIKTAIENHQNMIIEGCYIPFNWRIDFSPEYLSEISFYCLVQTNEYISSHFKEILEHESDIEVRLLEHDIDEFFLKKENEYYLNGFSKAGERIVQIDSDYDHCISKLLKSLT